MLLGGLLASLIFYLTIIFGKETIKVKLVWTFIVLAAIIVQSLTESVLIKSSYFIYLFNHDKELMIVNNVLKDKQGFIHIFDDMIIDDKKVLSKLEKDSLFKLREKLKVIRILKTDNRIYYELWGLLDVRIGITYCINGEMPNGNYKKIKDKWYY
jgi:hypothetical protein